MSKGYDSTVDLIVKFLKQLGFNVTGGVSDIAAWVAKNPAQAAIVAKAITGALGGIKSVGGIGNILAAIGAAHNAGFSYKQIMTALVKRAAGASAESAGLSFATKGAAVLSSLKVAGLVAATIFATESVKHAKKAWNVKLEALKNNPSAKTAWEFYWETRIPVVTYRQLRSLFTHDDGMTKKEKQREKLVQEANVALENYEDTFAKQDGMTSRPKAGTPAETEWKREVERRMSKSLKTSHTKTNDKSWYWRGLAAHLMSTDLTWTGLKEYNSDMNLSFTVAAAFRVSLLPPIKDLVLHPQLKSNIEILTQGLRGKNTGAWNYTEEDVYRYQMGLSAIIARARYLHKILATTKFRDIEVTDVQIYLLNALFPGNTFAQSRALYNDLIVNRASYCEQLNTIAKDVNTFPLKGNTLVSRWNYIADKCIKDYSGPKPVYGMYALQNIYMATAASETVYRFSKTCTSLASLINDLNAAVAEFKISGGVFGKIKGDYIKLMGANDKEAFNNIPYITGAEVVSFDYDVEAVDQLRSGRFCPLQQTVLSLPSYSGTAANYSIYYKWNTAGNTGTFKDFLYYTRSGEDIPVICTTERKDLDKAENIQMVQFGAGLDVANASGTASNTIHCGLSDCTPTILEEMSWITEGSAPVVHTCAGIINTDGDTLSYNTDNWLSVNMNASYVSDLIQMDFLPRIYIGKGYVAQFFVSPLQRLIDVDNYTTYTHKQFQQLNNVGVYSLTYLFSIEELKIMGILNS